MHYRCGAAGLQGFPAGHRQVQGATRAAQLISHDPQLIPVAVQPQHGEGEVASDGSDHPAGAQNDPIAIASQGCLHGFLAPGFAEAIDTQGIPLLIGPIRRSLLAVEDEIGAQLQQTTTGRTQGFSEGGRCCGIDGMGQIGF